MFYNVHAYVASKLYNSKDKLLLVGSMLPDIAITKIISWDEGLHKKENAKKFIQFIETFYPNYLFLGKGIYAHCVLDDFTHINYRGKIGYAFQNNEGLSELAGQYYNENKEKANGKAHNYIESAVDILLMKEHPEIQNLVRLAIKTINLSELSVLLSSYFQIDEGKFKQAIPQYFDLVTRYDLSDKNNWIFFWKDLNRMLKFKNIEDIEIKNLLDKSIDLTKNTYKDFLQYSISEGIREI